MENNGYFLRRQKNKKERLKDKEELVLMSSSGAIRFSTIRA